jgi:hypothetical protein
MSRQYSFLHICGHVGIGPILRLHAHERDIYNLPTYSEAERDTLRVPLLIPCPFCSGIEGRGNVQPGAGLIAVLASTAARPFEVEWQILRVCGPEEITSHDWNAAPGEWDIFRQMARIPKPCGRVFVRTLEGQGTAGVRLERRMEVECTWTQSLNTPVRSKLPGMLSELSAARIWSTRRTIN